jgi:hypothetical protein
VQRASGIPHALFGREIYQRLGRIARRGRERVFRRHCERSEAIHPSVAAMDCFASLAMTVYFGFSKNEYERATLSAVIAREGACEGY